MADYAKLTELKAQINAVFIGKEDVVENILICLLTGGHVLLEDVPGVGKTTLASTLAKSVGGSLGRIQFTPDTLPGDILGVSVYDRKTQDFVYRKGVIMNQILLADEINRTSPKTQSSLLEAMAEGQITVDGATYALPQPFMVIATQNPVEYLGTYPLPEAQLDRFMMRLSIGYPDREQEIRMATQHLGGITCHTIEPACDMQEVVQMKEAVEQVKVTPQILSYAEDLVELTRTEPRFLLGASPRALLALLRAAQGKAFMQGRDYVKPDDIKAVAEQVLLHRITLTSEAKMKKENTLKIMQSLILKARIPIS